MKSFRLFLVVVALSSATAAHAESADLSVAVSAPDSGLAGELFRWSVAVTNLGPDAAKDVVVHNFLNFMTANCGSTTSIPILQPGAVLHIDCSALLSVRFPGEYSQPVFGSVESSTPDPDRTNDSESLTIRAITPPDLSIHHPSGNLVVDPELPYRLEIVVQNSAWTAAERVTVSVHLPPDTTFASLPEGCSSSDGVAICELGTLGPTPDNRRLVLEPVAPSQEVATTIPFRMTVESEEEDFHPASNSFVGEIRMFDTFYVTTTADEGEGSLRSAIHSANAACDEQPCKIAFRISSSSLEPWHTLHPASPLPEVVGKQISIDGTTQTRFFGDTNEVGPEIEITGTNAGESSDGLVLRTACNSELKGLTINGFGGNGVLYVPESCERKNASGPFSFGRVTQSYLGCDPTGMVPLPNRWGIFVNSAEFGDYEIQDNVIGGNIRSGIFAARGTVLVSANRIGINRDLSGPLSNGASGVYIAGGSFNEGAHFSDVSHNYIGFNEHFGIGIASNANGVSIRGNSIQANWQQGIDIGLDGVTPETSDLQFTGALQIPAITMARWDPISGTTIIEGVIPDHEDGRTLEEWIIGVYANDAPDHSGFGEGQYFLGETELQSGGFSFAYQGDLRGKWIAATATSSIRTGFAKPGIEPTAFDIRSVVTATSEFSRAVEVSP